jgi:hypothetical protein
VSNTSQEKGINFTSLCGHEEPWVNFGELSHMDVQDGLAATSSVVWWSMVSRVEVMNLLQSLQGSHFGATVKPMKTTPTETLEVAICFTLLERVVIGAAAYRLNCQGECNLSCSRNILSHYNRIESLKNVS